MSRGYTNIMWKVFNHLANGAPKMREDRKNQKKHTACIGSGVRFWMPLDNFVVKCKKMFFFLVSTGQIDQIVWYIYLKANENLTPSFALRSSCS